MQKMHGVSRRLASGLEQSQDMTPSTRMVVMVVDLNGPMDKIRYSNAGRSVNPNGPLLRQALVEIGEELDRQAAGDKSLAFCPFGPIDAYLPDDAGARRVIEW